jgi:acetyl-CoA C-acetyltransferase
MRESDAKSAGITPLARIVGHSTFAHDPSWFTTAPVFAFQKLLKKVGWQTEDVDLWEINEAFAAVTMASMRDLKLPPTRSTSMAVPARLAIRSVPRVRGFW